MLSRIARNIFELGQQIERAENIARILDVNQRMSLEQHYFSELDVWSPMLAITNSREAFDERYGDVTRDNVLAFLISDTTHPYSIRTCLNHAREMARTIRERISEEMWLYLNKMYLGMEKVKNSGRQDSFLAEVRQFCSAFHGLVDNTMSHDESWNFMRLGISLERALMTSRILEIKYHLLLPSADEIGKPLDLHQWQALLRSVSGYEAYRRKYKARIEPPKVINLLNLDSRFPRSIHYCIRQLHEALQGIRISNRQQYMLSRETEIFLDDLRGGAAGEDVLGMGLKGYLESVQKRCGKISTMIYQTFFDSVTITVIHGNNERLSLQIPQQQQR